MSREEVKHVSIVTLRWGKGYIVRRVDENDRLLPGNPGIEVESKTFDYSDEACDAAQEFYRNATLDCGMSHSG